MLAFKVNCDRDVVLHFSAQDGEAAFTLFDNDVAPPNQLASSGGLVGDWNCTITGGSMSGTGGKDFMVRCTVASPSGADVTTWLKVENDGHGDIPAMDPDGEVHSRLGWQLATIPSGQFDEPTFTLVCA